MAAWPVTVPNSTVGWIYCFVWFIKDFLWAIVWKKSSVSGGESLGSCAIEYNENKDLIWIHSRNNRFRVWIPALAGGWTNSRKITMVSHWRCVTCQSGEISCELCVRVMLFKQKAGQQYTSLKTSFNYRCIAIRNGKSLEKKKKRNGKRLDVVTKLIVSARGDKAWDFDSYNTVSKI